MRKIKTITLRLDDDLHKKLKLHSVEIGEKMQDMLVRLIKNELNLTDEEEK